MAIRAGKCMPVTATEGGGPVPAATERPLDPTPDEHNVLRFRIWPETEVGLTYRQETRLAGWSPQRRGRRLRAGAGADMRP